MTSASGHRDAMSGDDGRPSRADLRMADLLAGSERATPSLRRRLLDEDGAEAEDLIARVNALEYLDRVVGEIGGDTPERLGEYRIVGLLGRGGMGTVYEAFQDSLERTVALKVLSPSMTSDPRMRRRFRTEARANATLHHQHIVPVYGFGEASGHLYFAMERVEGVSLDKHVSAARHRGGQAMEPREAARRFAGVADALAHAHRRGILHRDVKPGNILVHPDGTLALADFGLSKVVDEQSISRSQHGGFLGTLHYAAPEQARGRPATAASDLYSLGVTIYECVTGRLPLRSESTEALLQALLHEQPRPLRQVLPRAPRDLELVLEKLLAKEPEDRYADGEVLARDLLRVADDEPVHVRRRALPVRVWRVVRKHRLLSATAGVAFCLLLAVLGVWWLLLGEEELGRISTHEIQLAKAVARAEGELGRFDGPDGLLESLVGLELPDGETGDAVLALLDEAGRILPDDERAGALRAAYLGDPIPAATAALREGRGATARRLLDEEIARTETVSGFAARDSVTWLRLYRLYLTRAFACLTAAVADAEAASNDLLRASFVRPGAIAPALLSAIVSWQPERGAAALLSALEGLVARAPEGARVAAGALLRALAGIGRPAAANLMPFELPYPLRRELHARAEAWCGASDAAAPAEAALGPIERELARHAREAAASLAELPALRAALAPGQALLEREIAPTSPLQSWRTVFALLESNDPAGLGRPSVAVRGVEQLLGLGLPADVLRQLEPTIERVLDAADERGVPTQRARAALALAVGAQERAFAAASAWVQLDAEDPQAWFCRFRCRVAAGDLDWAATDALKAIQLAGPRDGLRQQVVAVLDAAARRDEANSDGWRRLADEFAN